MSIAQYIALMNRALHGNDPRFEAIPDSREAVAQLLLLHSSAGDPQAFDDLVSADYDQVRIVTRATVSSSTESELLRTKMLALVAKHFPESSDPESVLSTEILLSKAADTLSREQVRSFAGALVVILLAVVVGFRSFKAGALMILPNGLPILMNLGVMGGFGIPLNDTTSLVSAIALGVGVDSTVHLLAAVERGEAENGTRRGSLVQAMLAIGRPIILTSVAVIAGFSVLLLSDFRSIMEMGGLMSFTMFLCLAMDLVVTPAQLVAWYPEEVGSAAILHTSGGAVASVIEWEERDRLRVRLLDTPPFEVTAKEVILDCVSRGVQIQGRLTSPPTSGPCLDR